MPGAAADLQDVRARRRAGLEADQLGQDFAPPAIPPVAVVELGHLLIDDPFHQRKTSCRLSRKVASGVTKIAGIRGHHVGPWTSGPVSTQVNASLSRKPDAWTSRNLTLSRWSSLLPW